MSIVPVNSNQVGRVNIPVNDGIRTPLNSLLPVVQSAESVKHLSVKTQQMLLSQTQTRTKTPTLIGDISGAKTISSNSNGIPESTLSSVPSERSPRTKKLMSNVREDIQKKLNDSIATSDHTNTDHLITDALSTESTNLPTEISFPDAPATLDHFHKSERTDVLPWFDVLVHAVQSGRVLNISATAIFAGERNPQWYLFAMKSNQGRSTIVVHELNRVKFLETALESSLSKGLKASSVAHLFSPLEVHSQRLPNTSKHGQRIAPSRLISGRPHTVATPKGPKTPMTSGSNTYSIPPTPMTASLFPITPATGQSGKTKVTFSDINVDKQSSKHMQLPFLNTLHVLAAKEVTLGCKLLPVLTLRPDGRFTLICTDSTCTIRKTTIDANYAMSKVLNLRDPGLAIADPTSTSLRLYIGVLCRSDRSRQLLSPLICKEIFSRRPVIFDDGEKAFVQSTASGSLTYYSCSLTCRSPGSWEAPSKVEFKQRNLDGSSTLLNPSSELCPDDMQKVVLDCVHTVIDDFLNFEQILVSTVEIDFHVDQQNKPYVALLVITTGSNMTMEFVDVLLHLAKFKSVLGMCFPPTIVAPHTDRDNNIVLYCTDSKGVIRKRSHISGAYVLKKVFKIDKLSEMVEHIIRQGISPAFLCQADIKRKLLTTAESKDMLQFPMRGLAKSRTYLQAAPTGYAQIYTCMFVCSSPGSTASSSLSFGRRDLDGGVTWLEAGMNSETGQRVSSAIVNIINGLHEKYSIRNVIDRVEMDFCVDKPGSVYVLSFVPSLVYTVDSPATESGDDTGFASSSIPLPLFAVASSAQISQQPKSLVGSSVAFTPDLPQINETPESFSKYAYAVAERDSVQTPGRSRRLGNVPFIDLLVIFAKIRCQIGVAIPFVMGQNNETGELDFFFADSAGLVRRKKNVGEDFMKSKIFDGRKKFDTNVAIFRKSGRCDIMTLAQLKEAMNSHGVENLDMSYVQTQAPVGAAQVYFLCKFTCSTAGSAVNPTVEFGTFNARTNETNFKQNDADSVPLDIRGPIVEAAGRTVTNMRQFLGRLVDRLTIQFFRNDHGTLAVSAIQTTLQLDKPGQELVIEKQLTDHFPLPNDAAANAVQRVGFRRVLYYASKHKINLGLNIVPTVFYSMNTSAYNMCFTNGSGSISKKKNVSIDYIHKNVLGGGQSIDSEDTCVLCRDDGQRELLKKAEVRHLLDNNFHGVPVDAYVQRHLPNCEALVLKYISEEVAAQSNSPVLQVYKIVNSAQSLAPLHAAEINALISSETNNVLMAMIEVLVRGLRDEEGNRCTSLQVDFLVENCDKLWVASIFADWEQSQENFYRDDVSMVLQSDNESDSVNSASMVGHGRGHDFHDDGSVLSMYDSDGDDTHTRPLVFASPDAFLQLDAGYAANAVELVEYFNDASHTSWRPGTVVQLTPRAGVQVVVCFVYTFPQPLEVRRLILAKSESLLQILAGAIVGVTRTDNLSGEDGQVPPLLRHSADLIVADVVRIICSNEYESTTLTSVDLGILVDLEGTVIVQHCTVHGSDLPRAPMPIISDEHTFARMEVGSKLHQNYSHSGSATTGTLDWRTVLSLLAMENAPCLPEGVFLPDTIVYDALDNKMKWYSWTNGVIQMRFDFELSELNQVLQQGSDLDGSSIATLVTSGGNRVAVDAAFVQELMDDCLQLLCLDPCSLQKYAQGNGDGYVHKCQYMCDPIVGQYQIHHELASYIHDANVNEPMQGPSLGDLVGDMIVAAVLAITDRVQNVCQCRVVNFTAEFMEGGVADHALILLHISSIVAEGLTWENNHHTTIADFSVSSNDSLGLNMSLAADFSVDGVASDFARDRDDDVIFATDEADALSAKDYVNKAVSLIMGESESIVKPSKDIKGLAEKSISYVTLQALVNATIRTKAAHPVAVVRNPELAVEYREVVPRKQHYVMPHDRILARASKFKACLGVDVMPTVCFSQKRNQYVLFHTDKSKTVRKKKNITASFVLNGVFNKKAFANNIFSSHKMITAVLTDNGVRALLDGSQVKSALGEAATVLKQSNTWMQAFGSSVENHLCSCEFEQLRLIPSSVKFGRRKWNGSDVFSHPVHGFEYDELPDNIKFVVVDIVESLGRKVFEKDLANALFKLLVEFILERQGKIWIVSATANFLLQDDQARALGIHEDIDDDASVDSLMSKFSMDNDGSIVSSLGNESVGDLLANAKFEGLNISTPQKVDVFVEMKPIAPAFSLSTVDPVAKVDAVSQLHPSTLVTTTIEETTLVTPTTEETLKAVPISGASPVVAQQASELVQMADSSAIPAPAKTQKENDSGFAELKLAPVDSSTGRISFNTLAAASNSSSVINISWPHLIVKLRHSDQIRQGHTLLLIPDTVFLSEDMNMPLWVYMANGKIINLRRKFTLDDIVNRFCSNFSVMLQEHEWSTKRNVAVIRTPGSSKVIDSAELRDMLAGSSAAVLKKAGTFLQSYQLPFEEEDEILSCKYSVATPLLEQETPDYQQVAQNAKVDFFIRPFNGTNRRQRNPKYCTMMKSCVHDLVNVLWLDQSYFVLDAVVEFVLDISGVLWISNVGTLRVKTVLSSDDDFDPCSIGALFAQVALPPPSMSTPNPPSDPSVANNPNKGDAIDDLSAPKLCPSCSVTFNGDHRICWNCSYSGDKVDELALQRIKLEVSTPLSPSRNVDALKVIAMKDSEALVPPMKQVPLQQPQQRSPQAPQLLAPVQLLQEMPAAPVSRVQAKPIVSAPIGGANVITAGDAQSTISNQAQALGAAHTAVTTLLSSTVRRLSTIAIPGLSVDPDTKPQVNEPHVEETKESAMQQDNDFLDNVSYLGMEDDLDIEHKGNGTEMGFIEFLDVMARFKFRLEFEIFPTAAFGQNGEIDMYFTGSRFKVKKKTKVNHQYFLEKVMKAKSTGSSLNLSCTLYGKDFTRYLNADETKTVLKQYPDYLTEGAFMQVEVAVGEPFVCEYIAAEKGSESSIQFGKRREDGFVVFEQSDGKALNISSTCRDKIFTALGVLVEEFAVAANPKVDCPACERIVMDFIVGSRDSVWIRSINPFFSPDCSFVPDDDQSLESQGTLGDIKFINIDNAVNAPEVASQLHEDVKGISKPTLPLLSIPPYSSPHPLDYGPQSQVTTSSLNPKNNLGVDLDGLPTAVTQPKQVVVIQQELKEKEREEDMKWVMMLQRYQQEATSPKAKDMPLSSMRKHKESTHVEVQCDILMPEDDDSENINILDPYSVRPDTMGELLQQLVVDPALLTPPKRAWNPSMTTFGEPLSDNDVSMRTRILSSMKQQADDEHWFVDGNLFSISRDFPEKPIDESANALEAIETNFPSDERPARTPPHTLFDTMALHYRGAELCPKSSFVSYSWLEILQVLALQEVEGFNFAPTVFLSNDTASTMATSPSVFTRDRSTNWIMTYNLNSDNFDGVLKDIIRTPVSFSRGQSDGATSMLVSNTGRPLRMLDTTETTIVMENASSDMWGYQTFVQGLPPLSNPQSMAIITCDYRALAPVHADGLISGNTVGLYRYSLQLVASQSNSTQIAQASGNLCVYQDDENLQLTTGDDEHREDYAKVKEIVKVVVGAVKRERNQDVVNLTAKFVVGAGNTIWLSSIPLVFARPDGAVEIKSKEDILDSVSRANLENSVDKLKAEGEFQEQESATSVRFDIKTSKSAHTLHIPWATLINMLCDPTTGLKIKMPLATMALFDSKTNEVVVYYTSRMDGCVTQAALKSKDDIITNSLCGEHVRKEEAHTILYENDRSVATHHRNLRFESILNGDVDPADFPLVGLPRTSFIQLRIKTMDQNGSTLFSVVYQRSEDKQNVRLVASWLSNNEGVDAQQRVSRKFVSNATTQSFWAKAKRYVCDIGTFLKASFGMRTISFTANFVVDTRFDIWLSHICDMEVEMANAEGDNPDLDLTQEVVFDEVVVPPPTSLKHLVIEFSFQNVLDVLSRCEPSLVNIPDTVFDSTSDSAMSKSRKTITWFSSSESHAILKKESQFLTMAISNKFHKNALAFSPLDLGTVVAILANSVGDPVCCLTETDLLKFLENPSSPEWAEGSCLQSIVSYSKKIILIISCDYYSADSVRTSCTTNIVDQFMFTIQLWSAEGCERAVLLESAENLTLHFNPSKACAEIRHMLLDIIGKFHSNESQIVKKLSAKFLVDADERLWMCNISSLCTGIEVVVELPPESSSLATPATFQGDVGDSIDLPLEAAPIPLASPPQLSSSVPELVGPGDTGTLLYFDSLLSIVIKLSVKLSVSVMPTVLYISDSDRLELYYTDKKNILRKKKSVSPSYVLEKVLNPGRLNLEDQKVSLHPSTFSVVGNHLGVRQFLSVDDTKRVVVDENLQVIRQGGHYIQGYIGATDYFVCELISGILGQFPSASIGRRRGDGTVEGFDVKSRLTSDLTLNAEQLIIQTGANIIKSFEQKAHAQLRKLVIDFVVDKRGKPWMSLLSVELVGDVNNVYALFDNFDGASVDSMDSISGAEFPADVIDAVPLSRAKVPKKLKKMEQTAPKSSAGKQVPGKQFSTKKSRQQPRGSSPDSRQQTDDFLRPSREGSKTPAQTMQRRSPGPKLLEKLDGTRAKTSHGVHSSYADSQLSDISDFGLNWPLGAQWTFVKLMSCFGDLSLNIGARILPVVAFDPDTNGLQLLYSDLQLITKKKIRVTVDAVMKRVFGGNDDGFPIAIKCTHDKVINGPVREPMNKSEMLDFLEQTSNLSSLGDTYLQMHPSSTSTSIFICTYSVPELMQSPILEYGRRGIDGSKLPLKLSAIKTLLPSDALEQLLPIGSLLMRHVREVARLDVVTIEFDFVHSADGSSLWLLSFAPGEQRVATTPLSVGMSQNQIPSPSKIAWMNKLELDDDSLFAESSGVDLPLAFERHGFSRPTPSSPRNEEVQPLPTTQVIKEVEPTKNGIQNGSETLSPTLTVAQLGPVQPLQSSAPAANDAKGPETMISTEYQALPLKAAQSEPTPLLGATEGHAAKKLDVQMSTAVNNVALTVVRSSAVAPTRRRVSSSPLMKILLSCAKINISLGTPIATTAAFDEENNLYQLVYCDASFVVKKKKNVTQEYLMTKGFKANGKGVNAPVAVLGTGLIRKSVTASECKTILAESHSTLKQKDAYLQAHVSNKDSFCCVVTCSSPGSADSPSVEFGQVNGPDATMTLLGADETATHIATDTRKVLMNAATLIITAFREKLSFLVVDLELDFVVDDSGKIWITSIMTSDLAQPAMQAPPQTLVDPIPSVHASPSLGPSVSVVSQPPPSLGPSVSVVSQPPPSLGPSVSVVSQPPLTQASIGLVDTSPPPPANLSLSEGQDSILGSTVAVHVDSNSSPIQPQKIDEAPSANSFAIQPQPGVKDSISEAQVATQDKPSSAASRPATGTGKIAYCKVLTTMVKTKMVINAFVTTTTFMDLESKQMQLIFTDNGNALKRKKNVSVEHLLYNVFKVNDKSDDALLGILGYKGGVRKRITVAECKSLLLEDSTPLNDKDTFLQLIDHPEKWYSCGYSCNPPGSIDSPKVEYGIKTITGGFSLMKNDPDALTLIPTSVRDICVAACECLVQGFHSSLSLTIVRITLDFYIEEGKVIVIFILPLVLANVPSSRGSNTGGLSVDRKTPISSLPPIRQPKPNSGTLTPTANTNPTSAEAPNSDPVETLQPVPPAEPAKNIRAFSRERSPMIGAAERSYFGSSAPIRPPTQGDGKLPNKRQTISLPYLELLSHLAKIKLEIRTRMPSIISIDPQKKSLQLYYVDPSGIMKKKRNIDAEYALQKVLKVSSVIDQKGEDGELALLCLKNGSREALTISATKVLLEDESPNSPFQQKDAYLQTFVPPKDIYMCEYTCSSPGSTDSPMVAYGKRHMDGSSTPLGDEGENVIPGVARGAILAAMAVFVNGLRDNLNLPMESATVDFVVDQAPAVWILSVTSNIAFFMKM